MAKIKSKNTGIIINAFYEDKDGNIILTSSSSPTVIGVKKSRHGKPEYEPKSSFLQNYKIRHDINDFPNSPDPVLPYSFDLFWDLKLLSDLENCFKYNPFNYDLEAIKDMVRECNVNIDSHFLSIDHNKQLPEGIKEKWAVYDFKGLYWTLDQAISDPYLLHELLADAKSEYIELPYASYEKHIPDYVANQSHSFKV